tara:strand:- start:32 stop:280 length:249 start_codon:yes stop_codon:yes gene_type:complete
MTKSKEWLLYNAVLSWLANYGGMGSDYTPQYQELLKEVEKNYEQSINPQTRKRGRAAKRQRTQKATSNSSSTKESKTTNQEA